MELLANLVGAGFVTATLVGLAIVLYVIYLAERG